MKTHPRLRTAALFSLALLAGCDGNVVVPGLVAPGDNRPPVITAPKIELTSQGLLKISATIFDPNGDGLTVTYDQRSGPFAAQQSALLVGGAYSALLRPDGAGTYAFRLDASDGFFHTNADVNLTIPDTSAPGARVEPAGRPLPAGRFKIRLNGQVVADEGFAPFALDGELDLAAPPASYAGQNQSIVTLKTRASPLAGAAPAGSLSLNSAGGLDGINVHAFPSGRNVLIRLDNQSGPLTDLLDLSVVGGDLVLTGPSDAAARAGVSVAQFRTAEMRATTLDAGSVLLDLRISGQNVTGTIYISTRDVATADLPSVAEYSATLTGTSTQ